MRRFLGIDFAAALRRSELVAIEVADVKFVDDGLRLLIPRSKMGPDRRSRRGRGDPARLISALSPPCRHGWRTRAWFRPVKLGGEIGDVAKIERQRGRSRAETTLPARRRVFNQLQRAQFACGADHEFRRGECKYLPNSAGKSASKPSRACKAMSRSMKRSSA